MVVFIDAIIVITVITIHILCFVALFLSLLQSNNCVQYYFRLCAAQARDNFRLLCYDGDISYMIFKIAKWKNSVIIILWSTLWKCVCVAMKIVFSQCLRPASNSQTP